MNKKYANFKVFHFLNYDLYDYFDYMIFHFFYFIVAFNRFSATMVFYSCTSATIYFRLTFFRSVIANNAVIPHLMRNLLQIIRGLRVKLAMTKKRDAKG